MIDWVEDYYYSNENPIEATAVGRKKELVLKWTGPKDAPGMIGYPHIRRVKLPDGEYYHELQEGVVDVPIKRIGEWPQNHCIIVVRTDVYGA